MAALQHLPARQRAVLILCEVLRWQASEVAELLDTTVAAVNSALQRSRATLASIEAGPSSAEVDDDQRQLLDSYVEAFERYDVETLVTLLREDVIQSMPPYAMWLQGNGDIGRFMLGLGIGCRVRASYRRLPMASRPLDSTNLIRRGGTRPGRWWSSTSQMA